MPISRLTSRIAPTYLAATCVFVLTLNSFLWVGSARAAASDSESKLVAAAKKEGQLNYMDNLMAPESRKAMQDAFRKRYGLSNFVFKPQLLKSAEVVARVGQELSAGRVTIDWVSVNVASFWKDLKSRGALLEYCSPQYKAFSGLSGAGIPDGGCFYHASHGVAFTPMWNPKFVKEKLDSWRDFTNPKYKGQIIMSDATKAPVYLDTYIGLRKILDTSYFKGLAAQRPFFLVRSTEIRDKVMTGEFPIAVLGYAPRAYQVRDKVELDVSYPKEGVVLLGAFGGILAKAPHPNAAKLWTDFFYSKEGQSVLVKYEGVISGRNDISVGPEVRKYVPALSDLKLIPVDWDKITKEDREKARAEFRSIFFGG